MTCSNVCTCPRSPARPSGPTPSHSARCAAGPRRSRELLDADLHQLAAPGALRPGLVARLPKRRPGRHRSPHAGVSFEHDIDGVRQATRERAIDLPVAVENDFAIWNAFTNNGWPALYFIDTDGKDPRPALRRRTLREIGAPHPEAARRRPRARLVQGLGVEAKADWDHVRTSSRGPSGGAGQFAGQHRQSNNVPPSKRAVPVRSRSPTHAFLRASQHVRPFWRSSGGPPERPARPRETLVVRCIGHELVTTGGPIRPGGGPCSPLRNPPP
jgi:hypothetical protein